MVPLAGPHNKKVTWWTTDLAAFRSRNNCSEKRWQKLCKKHGDEHTYTLEGKEYYTQLRNTYTNKIRQAKETSLEKFITESSEDMMNDLWECIYIVVFNKYKSETKITALKVDNHFVENEYDIVIALLNGLLPNDDFTDSESQSKTRFRMQNYIGHKSNDTFDEHDLLYCVTQLKNRIAPGFDGLKAEIIKRSYGCIKMSLLAIMNEMWTTGVFPDDWKNLVLKKIFLKHQDKDPSLIKFYRPITLLPVLGKVAEKLIGM